MVAVVVIAKRTILELGREEAYEAVHRDPPQSVVDSLRAAGVDQWRIWRSGVDLFHVIDVDDRERMRVVTAADPVIAEWNARMRRFLRPTPPEYAADLRPVWTLS